jgi:cell division ATPase FtsA
VEIGCQRWEQFVELCTENVSRNGLLVRLGDPLPVGTATEVRLTAPDGSVLTLAGEVVRVVGPAHQGGEPGMAIRILEPDLKELEDRAVAMSRARSEAGGPPPASAYGTTGPPSKIPHGQWFSGDELGDDDDDELEEDLLLALDDQGDEEDREDDFVLDDRPTDPYLGRGAAAKVVRRRAARGGPAASPGRYVKTYAGEGRPDDDRPSAADALLGGPPPRRVERPAPAQPRAPRAPDFSPPRSTYPPPPPPSEPGAPQTTPLPRVPTLVGRAAPIIGLDFGTTYSKVAFAQAGEVVLIEEEGSQRVNPAAIPSVVAFPEPGGPPVVGERARDLQPDQPERVIPLIKRLLGRRLHDPSVDGVLGSLACRSFAGPEDAILLEIDGEQMTVVQVVSHVLRHLKSLADAASGSNVKQAVLTAPVDFDERAQRELKLAARIAGLETVAIIPEPTAAVIGCGHDGSREATVAVVDFGGGTFDVAIVEARQARLDVLGSAGDRWLGGADIDAAIARYVADEFYRAAGINLHRRADQLLRLLQVCEESKRWLSTLPLADVILPRAGHTAEGPQTLFVPVTRACLEELSAEIIDSSLAVCGDALSQSRLTTEQVDEVLVTGGTTRVPAVREAVRRLFGRDPRAGVHPENAVVMGAAVYAAMLSGVRLSRVAGPCQPNCPHEHTEAYINLHYAKLTEDFNSSYPQRVGCARCLLGSAVVFLALEEVLELDLHHRARLLPLGHGAPCASRPAIGEHTAEEHEEEPQDDGDVGGDTVEQIEEVTLRRSAVSARSALLLLRVARLALRVASVTALGHIGRFHASAARLVRHYETSIGSSARSSAERRWSTTPVYSPSFLEGIAFGEHRQERPACLIIPTCGAVTKEPTYTAPQEPLERAAAPRELHERGAASASQRFARGTAALSRLRGHVMAGDGAAAITLLEQAPDLDALLRAMVGALPACRDGCRGAASERRCQTPCARSQRSSPGSGTSSQRASRTERADQRYCGRLNRPQAYLFAVARRVK